MLSGLYSILTVPVYGILYVITAVGIFTAIFLTWINARKPLTFLTMIWAKSVFLLMGKVIHVKGKENMVKGKKYILTANHASLFDIVAIVSFYPEVSWFGHERLLKVPVFGKFLRMTDYVPFREPTVTNTRHMLEQLIERANDRTVALFPEGTRTTSGKINPFYRGFIYLFRSRDIDILPVTLNGFYNFKPKTRFYINFGTKLEIVIHKPVPRESLANKTDEEIRTSIKEIIESEYH